MPPHRPQLCAAHRVSEILDRLVTAGATDVGNIAFLVSDPSKALDEARKAAIAGILLKKPFRAIILAAASHAPAKRLRGLLLQALCDRCAHSCLLRTLPAFGHSIARRSLNKVPSS